MQRLVEVLAGPLIWLASLAVVSWIGARGCAPAGVVLLILCVALAGCIGVLYRALSRVRSPALAGNDQARLWHFVAGGTAALSMAAIGATAFYATLTASC